MYIKRKIDSALEDWKNDSRHKPLLLRGARQTGKTTAVRHLAEGFDSYIEINFEKNRKIHEAFAGDLDVKTIVSLIEYQFDKPVVPGRTLLFLDEIQECPRAISALRFFYEDMQSLHVIAAGSLLEFVFDDLSDFGVGRIRNMFVYPLSYAEFAGALGAGVALERARGAAFDKPLPGIAHGKLLDVLKSFLIVGGMPAAVERYVETGMQSGKTLMLLSGTTCDCETNLVVAPDRLAEKYQLICVDYSGFDGNNLKGSCKLP